MKTFKDSAGREWSIALTMGAMHALKQLPVGRDDESVDLLDPQSGEPTLFIRLHTDDWLMIGVLQALLRKQMLKQGVSDEDLIDAIDGATYETARAAFFAEWSDFFLQRGQTNLCAAMVMMKDAKAEAVEWAMEQAGKTDVRALIRQTLGTTFGKPPESLASE